MSTFAEKKEEAKAAVEGMQRKLAERMASDSDWKAHLAFMGRLRSYSPRNALLMWAQWEDRKMGIEAIRAMETIFFGGPVTPSLPEFTAAAGFTAWKDMGGMVRKGEKALSVLAPVVVNDKDEIDPATGKPKKKLIGFVLKSRTFDISQVEGVEVPKPIVTLLTGNGPEGAWDLLVKLAEGNGYSVNIEGMAGTKNGFTRWADKYIGIKASNQPAQQVKTLAHEVAHMLLHSPVDLPQGMPERIMEVEAESVAYTVMSMLGFESDDYSLGYVHGWSNGDAALVGSTMERVVNTATRIIGYMETGELPKAKASGKYEFVTEATLAA